MYFLDSHENEHMFRWLEHILTVHSDFSFQFNSWDEALKLLTADYWMTSQKTIILLLSFWFYKSKIFYMKMLNLTTKSNNYLLNYFNMIYFRMFRQYLINNDIRYLHLSSLFNLFTHTFQCEHIEQNQLLVCVMIQEEKLLSFPVVPWINTSSSCWS